MTRPQPRAGPGCNLTSVRVIGGSSRGRRLKAPDRPGLRPTSDRVREAMFDILGSLGGVEGLDVVDLFAGSGALGIEALSRGAASATFVETDRVAASAIEANLVSAGFGHSGAGLGAAGAPDAPTPAVRVVRVVRSDAISYLRNGAGPFDVAFCDPPYDFEQWPELLAVLRADIAVLESRVPVDPPETFLTHRVYRYGGTLVTLAKARSRAAPKG
jgi:16S rRNA (guanine966-N2)-methyltransferase